MRSKANGRDLNSDAIKSQLNKLLGSFTVKMSHSLPELSSGADSKDGHNQFDVHIREHKVQEWETLCENYKCMSAQLLLQTIEEVEEFIDRLERISHEVMPVNLVEECRCLIT